jgi:hypothetical protein
MMDGSSTTILSLYMISVFAVPRSMAMSEVKKSNMAMQKVGEFYSTTKETAIADIPKLI